MTAMLLAGGYGMRMHDATGGAYPKHLYKIGGETLLEHSLKPFRAANVQRTVLMLGNMAAMIADHFDGSEVETHIVEEPIGIIPEIQLAIDSLSIEGDIILTEGDSIRSNLDIARLYEQHRQSNANATVAVTSRPLEGASGYHGVILGDQDEVSRVLQPGGNVQNKFPMIGLVALSESAVTLLLDASEEVTGWSSMLSVLHDASNMYASIQEVDYFNVNTPKIANDAEVFLGSRKP